MTVRIALLAVDPPGLTFFDSFDPDSYSVIAALQDALVHIDPDGNVAPGLATSWQRLTPVLWRFELRAGVRFHNGEPFDADCVVETFRAHQSPTPTATWLAMFAGIREVRATGPLQVEFELSAPNAMFLRGLIFGGIYPKGVLRAGGRDALVKSPIGTGAYRLLRYEPGRELVLERNREHWAGRATVDRIELPIVSQNEWIEKLEAGRIDAAWSIDAHDRLRAAAIPGLTVRSRRASIAHWFLLSDRGPLADVRVRRAMNHAVHRRLLVELTEHGFGLPQRSVQTGGDATSGEGDPFPYSPDLARSLLSEAGHAGGLTLHGMVSETSSALFFAVREFLARVGVRLEAEIVPRAEWIRRVAGAQLTGVRYEGDFGLLSIDNPLDHGLFPHSILLFSQGPSRFSADPEYDRRFFAAMAEAEPGPAMADLEKHARDRAMLLFTVQQEVHAAFRAGVETSLPRTGHFDYTAYWDLRCDREIDRDALPRLPAASSQDVALLREATGHTGAFYLKPDAAIHDPWLQRVWRNVDGAQRRWWLQNQQTLATLFELLEAKNALGNVLGSSDRVAIVGYSLEGRCLFANLGYTLTFGEPGGSPAHHLGESGPTGWATIRNAVDTDGSWLGPIALPATEQRSALHLFLAVTAARDEDGTQIGYTLVFTDHSGEEERIRHAAIRTILDNVPYGLFILDADGCMQAGYSSACQAIFAAGADDLHGRSFAELVGMDVRQRDHFVSSLAQVFDDLLPSGVTLAMLPHRCSVHDKTYSLSGSVVRGDGDEVTGVLFTMLDISALVAAEREAELHRATVLVLRYRASFEAFLRDLDVELRELLTAPQPIVRRALHTAKGVFAQFGLTALAARIHAIEDEITIGAAALRALRDEVRALVRDHAAVWHIDLDRVDPTFAIHGSRLEALASALERVDDLEALRATARSVLEEVRLRPAGELLGPLAETAQRLAERRGRKVTLNVVGAELPVPLTLAPVLRSLVHLVRNAIDHGIEPVEERRGKPPTARLDVEVRRDRDELSVSISDDGRGIDIPALRDRVIARGRLDAATANRLSEQELLACIFDSGASTAATVSEASGRGVGVSAVLETVRACGGRVDVATDPGRGTRFLVRLPWHAEAALTPR